MDIQAGSMSVSVPFRCITAAGVLLDRLGAADFSVDGVPSRLYFQRDNEAKIAVPITYKVTDAWLEGGIRQIGDDGWYNWDVPNTAVASGSRTLRIGGTVAGGVLLSAPVTLLGGVEYQDVNVVQVYGAVPATLDDFITALWMSPYSPFNMSAAQIAAVVDGDDLTLQRGDTLVIALTALGNMSTRTKLWFTLKASPDDADANALVQISEAGGLLYINGIAATTAANGSIVVTDAVTGAITITIAAAESAKLQCASTLFYDVQMLTPTTVRTLTSGNAAIVSDVTRATA